MDQWKRKSLLLAAVAALFVVACDGGSSNDGDTSADASGDVTVNPDTKGPDGVTNPDTSNPDTSSPDTSKPDTITPDTTKPDTTNPDTTTPDTTGPDASDPCGNKECGTGSDGSSCGTCSAGQVCTVLGQCRVPKLPDGSYCGVTADCTAQIPDPSGGPDPVDNPNWPACAHAQCESNLCGSLGQPGAIIFNVPVCTRPCNITKDQLDNTSGVESPDGVEDLDTPINECEGFADGPNGSDFRCVDFGHGLNQSGLSFCEPTKSFDSCQGNSDCPEGESCQFAVVGNSFTQRCAATQKSGTWFQVADISEECNGDPASGQQIECGGGFCYGLGCVPFCKNDADCDTTTVNPGTGCDTAAGTCKGWPEQACTADVDCSAWTCSPGRTPFGTQLDFTTSLCWPRGCDKSVDCAPGNYCQWSWDGEPGVDAGLDNLCLAETPGGKALGEACETDDDCAGYCEAGYCSTLCDDDSDCATDKGQLCAIDELLGDASGDNLADFVLVVPQCHTLPGTGGSCLGIGDCEAGETCAHYEVPNYLPETSTLDPDAPYTTRGKCIPAEAGKGQWGDLCGTNAAADFLGCQSGFCRRANADGTLGYCTHGCTSHLECPAITFQAGTPNAQSFSGLCISDQLGFAGNLDDPTRWTWESVCVIGNPASSLTDCSETLTCDEEGEACAPFVISFGPDVPSTVDYVCDDLKTDAGVGPTKNLGESCDPDAVDANGDPVEECKGGICLPDEVGGGNYCSQLCKPESDTTCAGAGLICSPRVTQPKAGKYKVNEASFGLCTKDQDCEPCVSSGFCPAGRICANLGQQPGSLDDFRCIPACETASDCAGTPSAACTEGVDGLGQKAMGCFELKDEIPVDYCLGN